MIGAPNGVHVSITGLGTNVPERVVTNDELAQHVDTSDEWIRERTGIRERRMASKEEALSDVALPAVNTALAQAGSEGKDIDLLIVATVTPDMAFPSTGAILADRIGATGAAAYDLSAGCTGFVYALAQAYGMVAGGLAKRALVVGGDLLSRILDWEDRSTLVLFGDGAGAVVLEAAEVAPSLSAMIAAVDGNAMSGVTVATISRSTSLPSTPACASASRAAGSATSDSASSFDAIRRSRIPVRSKIHSSDVSTYCASSSFVTMRSGTLQPRPVIVTVC